MSNDLISRSAVYNKIAELEELARNRVLDTPTSSPCYKRYVAQLNERTALKQLLADEPTAYDVDKVVGRLEEQANQYHERANKYASKGIDRQVEHMACKACSYEYAIEVVKTGGIED